MTVVGFTGHQNIPAEAIEYVKEHLRTELKTFSIPEHSLVRVHLPMELTNSSHSSSSMLAEA